YGLYGAEEDGFLARMEYGKGLRTWTRDVRPSDALALAVASGAPVYAHRSLMSGNSPERFSCGEPGRGDDYLFMEAGRA
ncbi:MAG: hypothetical protein CVV51_04545, partial [Spirochaetae bacterium HGW-Spirochaetae-7]